MHNNRVIFELGSYTYIDVLGADSEKLLQGQISIDVSKILSGTAKLAVLCNPKGRIVALFHIHRVTGGFRLILPREISEQTISHIKKYAVFYKVNISSADDSSHLFAISSIATENIEPQAIVLPSIDLSIIFEENDVSLASYAESTDSKILHSDEYWYWQLAANHIAWLTTDTYEHFLPHNLDLPKLSAIDFNKGCFTGQEVIARMQYKGKLKQHLQLLKTEQIADILPLEKLKQGDKKVAEVVCQTNKIGEGSLVLALVKDSADKDKAFKNGHFSFELFLSCS